MRTLISLALALTFVLGFIFSADLFAGEKETETMLIKQGWVRLSVEELRALKDYTAGEETGWALYVDPTGTNYVYRHWEGGIKKGKTRITAAGKICFKPDFLGFSGNVGGCRSVWKLGKVYLNLKSDGTYFSKYEIKPGNTENL